MKVKMSEHQWNLLSQSCKRELIRKLMIIETPQNVYSLGARGNKWEMHKMDNTEWVDGYEVIDEWV